MSSKAARTISVKDKKIKISVIGDEDFICLTDMISDLEGDSVIKNWLRNRNTLDYIGLWEKMHNPSFKLVEFDQFRIEAGKNTFTISPKKWIDSTNAIGIVSKSGRGGGTYAHKDIAFKFATWLSPEFELYMVKDYQRLKAWESSEANQEWNLRRMFAKVNYQIQTDAIEQYLIPLSTLPADKLGIEYAQEADMLNHILFGITAKEWKAQNPDKDKAGLNIRDDASFVQLTVLANMQSLNALLMKSKFPRERRIEKLSNFAKSQIQVLLKDARIQSLTLQERLRLPSGSDKELNP